MFLSLIKLLFFIQVNIIFFLLILSLEIRKF